MTAADKLLKMVIKWQDDIPYSEENREKVGELTQILNHLRYLERIKFQDYDPTRYSQHPISFMERFHAWLNNKGLSPENQRDLFEFAYYLAFFSKDDFAALFQNAFSGPITRWCMDEASSLLDQSDWLVRLNEERYKKTWYCPVTDSLLISQFHHINGIEGQDHKPVFRELICFADGNEKIKKHIESKDYKRLVLLEDFVGTGTQTFNSIKWALENLGIPILFCPMIIAPEAVNKFRKLKEKIEQQEETTQPTSRFEIEPIFLLDSGCFVHDTGRSSEQLFNRIKILAEDIHSHLSKSNQQFQHGALGFCKSKSTQKGATVVMFSNTPNNSLPLIHHSVDDWKSLFPRVARQLR